MCQWTWSAGRRAEPAATSLRAGVQRVDDGQILVGADTGGRFHGQSIDRSATQIPGVAARRAAWSIPGANTWDPCATHEFADFARGATSDGGPRQHVTARAAALCREHERRFSSAARAGYF